MPLASRPSTKNPLADTVDACRAMVQVADRSGKLAMISQSRRYNDRHVALCDAIRAGRIGAYGGSNWTHQRIAAANV